MESIKSYQSRYNPEKLFTGYLRIADSVIITKPTVYGMQELLSEIGGLWQSLFVLLAITNVFLSRQFFLR